MKHIGIIVIGFLLLGALFGAASASITTAAPGTQRATRTPSPTAVRRVPVTLVARPLPILVPITATAVVTASPTVTATLRTSPTPRTTPTTTTTPTAAPAADAPKGIVDFSASASRLRGQIDLRWGYIGVPFDGAFIVERSANGGVWRYVADCTQTYVADATTYRCPDTGLTSGASYAYRACIVEYGSSCASAVAVESNEVKAP